MTDVPCGVLNFFFSCLLNHFFHAQRLQMQPTCDDFQTVLGLSSPSGALDRSLCSVAFGVPAASYRLYQCYKLQLPGLLFHRLQRRLPSSTWWSKPQIQGPSSLLLNTPPSPSVKLSNRLNGRLRFGPFPGIFPATIFTGTSRFLAQIMASAS